MILLLNLLADSQQVYRKADLAVLGSLTALTAMKPIYKNRRFLIFPLVLVRLGAASFLLTDYKNRW